MNVVGSEGEVLLHPISGDHPCGQNLEDTPLLASFDTFRLFGQATPLEPAPEWTEIRDSASVALQKSKDLRLLAHLASAVLRTDGLPAFAETLTVAAEWLGRYWSHVYPLVDEDAILRRSALNCFADQMAVIDGVRRAPLVDSRQHGRFSLRDFDVASGQLQPAGGEARPDEARINAAFAAMPLEDLTRMQQSAAAALAALHRIDSLMRDGGGPGAAPSFDGLSSQLGRIDRILRVQLAARPNGGGDTAAGAMDSAPAAAAPATVGAIRSREDAIRALDAVAEFFRRSEPSSPIPLFLERAKRLVSKDFLEVLADIAPDALAQARAAGGLRDGE
jgi:type VI secretion system protein ImpA